MTDLDNFIAKIYKFLSHFGEIVQSNNDHYLSIQCNLKKNLYIYDIYQNSESQILENVKFKFNNEYLKTFERYTYFEFYIYGNTISVHQPIKIDIIRNDVLNNNILAYINLKNKLLNEHLYNIENVTYYEIIRSGINNMRIKLNESFLFYLKFLKIT